MKYKVHRLDVKRATIQQQLQDYLDLLKGEIVAIVPNVRPVFQPMGATARTSFLLIVERVEA